MILIVFHGSFNLPSNYAARKARIAPFQKTHTKKKKSPSSYQPPWMVIQRSSDGHSKVGGIFIVLEKITEGREQVAVGGRGGSSRGKSNPPRALYTSLFTSQMFPQTLSVGCGPRRVESQHGLYWLSCAHCVMQACCVRKSRLFFMRYSDI